MTGNHLLFQVTFRMSPDPKKIQGIMEMPAPRDAAQLQSFLGMVNFLHPFIPHLSTNTAPWRELLTMNAVFQWTPSPNAAFLKLKSLMAEAEQSSLRLYNRNLPIVAQCYANVDWEQIYCSSENQLHSYPSLFLKKKAEICQH